MPFLCSSEDLDFCLKMSLRKTLLDQGKSEKKKSRGYRSDRSVTSGVVTHGTKGKMDELSAGNHLIRTSEEIPGVFSSELRRETKTRESILSCERTDG